MTRTDKETNDYSRFPMGFGTAELDRSPGQERACLLIKTAVRSGIRLIDTAAVYGSETAVGKAVREMIRDGEIRREELFIQSKLAPDCHGRAKTQKCLEASLEQTQLDYLDAYLIHWPVPRYLEDSYRERNLESWRVMEEFYRAGKLRALGVCNFLERHLLDIFDGCSVPPKIGQLEIHPKFQQRGLCRFYRSRGLQIQAWGSVMNAADSEIHAVAEKYGKSVQQICLRWSIQKGFLPLMRSISEEHIRQNTEILDFTILADDMVRLDALNTDSCYREMWSYKRQKMY